VAFRRGRPVGRPPQSGIQVNIVDLRYQAKSRSQLSRVVAKIEKRTDRGIFYTYTSDHGHRSIILMKKTKPRRVLLLNSGKEDNFVVNRIHLGLTLLASILMEAGHQVRIIDYAFLRHISQLIYVPSIEKVIKDFQPDVIGLSVFTYLWDDCEKLIERISRCSSAPIILGGTHFTIFPEDFSSDPRISYIVRGEAESIILNLVESAKKESPPVIINAPPTAPEAIPPCNLDVAYGSQYLERYQVQLSRGCAHHCSFCSIPSIGGSKLRARDLNIVMDQIIKAKQKYPRIKEICITDDFPSYNKERFKRFLRLLKEANTGCLLWVDNMRADSIDDEMVSLYRAAGGYNICIGVESGNPEVFKLINKGESLPVIIEAAKKVRKNGIVLGLCFVIGLPGDNIERHKDSIRLAKLLRPQYIFWNMVNPYPGTEVNKWYKQHGEVGDNRNFSTLIDPKANFVEPRWSSEYFPKKDMVKAWLMANMETHDYLASPKNILKLYGLSRSYGTYHSFIILLLHNVPIYLLKRSLPSSVRAEIRNRFPGLVGRIRNIIQ
jgi:anaerobic magnesium-protoporphyrin IX monomethyl ester cyclase